MQNKQKIAIIGGGILGLCTAYYLNKSCGDNCDITLIEKNEKLGGLTLTSRVEGMELERFYHHFFKSDKALQGLLNELGLGSKLRRYPSKMGIYHKNKLIDFSSAVDILKFPNLSFFSRLRLGIGSLFLQKWPSKKSFEGVYAIDWCNKFFGKDITKIFWEPLLKAKFAGDYNKIGMLWLRARLRDRASSRGLPWKDEQLGYIDGSINTLIVKLMERLEKGGVKIVTKADITSYKYKVKKHRMSYQVGGITTKDDYDVIVSTITPKSFTKIFDPPKRYINDLSKIKFLGAICLTLTLKKQFMPYYWLTINDPEKPFLAVIEHTNLIDKALYGYKSVLYLGKYLSPKDELYNLTEDEIVNIAVKFLKEINPDFDNTWIDNASIIKTETAQHILDLNAIPPLPTVGKNGLYYAHFSQIYEHDRGVNYAIAQSLDLSNLIIKNERINNNT